MCISFCYWQSRFFQAYSRLHSSRSCLADPVMSHEEAALLKTAWKVSASPNLAGLACVSWFTLVVDGATKPSQDQHLLSYISSSNFILLFRRCATMMKAGQWLNLIQGRVEQPETHGRRALFRDPLMEFLKVVTVFFFRLAFFCKGPIYHCRWLHSLEIKKHSIDAWVVTLSCILLSQYSHSVDIV